MARSIVQPCNYSGLYDYGAYPALARFGIVDYGARSLRLQAHLSLLRILGAASGPAHSASARLSLVGEPAA